MNILLSFIHQIFQGQAYKTQHPPQASPSTPRKPQAHRRVAEQRTQPVEMAASALNMFVAACLLALVVAAGLRPISDLSSPGATLTSVTGLARGSVRAGD